MASVGLLMKLPGNPAYNQPDRPCNNQEEMEEICVQQNDIKQRSRIVLFSRPCRVIVSGPSPLLLTTDAQTFSRFRLSFLISFYPGGSINGAPSRNGFQVFLEHMPKPPSLSSKHLTDLHESGFELISAWPMNTKVKSQAF